jgi:hypothetical protein
VLRCLQRAEQGCCLGRPCCTPGGEAACQPCPKHAQCCLKAWLDLLVVVHVQHAPLGVLLLVL